MLDRGYENTTVDDVVERSNIGRSTLYAHFGGLEGLLRQTLTNPSTRLAMLVDEPVDMDRLIGQLEHFREQRRRNKAFFEPPIRGMWVRRLAELIEPRLEALARARGGAPTLLPSAFVATQVAEAQIALVTNWLSLRPTTSPEVIARAMVSMTQATVEGLVLSVETAEGAAG
jgi:AcrR family transcriptional regulator